MHETVDGLELLERMAWEIYHCNFNYHRRYENSRSVQVFFKILGGPLPPPPEEEPDRKYDLSRWKSYEIDSTPEDVFSMLDFEFLSPVEGQVPCIYVHHFSAIYML